MKKAILLLVMFFLVIGFKLKSPIISVDLVNLLSIFLILYLIVFKTKFFLKLNIHAFNLILMAALIFLITLFSIVANGFISYELISIVFKILLFTIASYTLVLMYRSVYQDSFKPKILRDLYLIISIHSIIIVLMYILSDFREFVYEYSNISDLKKLKYTGATRVAGFTGGGGALSSLLQATSLIIFIYLRKVVKINTVSVIIFNLLNIITLFSIVIVGRTGLYLFIISLPYILYSLYGLSVFKKLFRIFKIRYIIAFLLISFIVLLIVNFQSDGVIEKFIDQSLSRAINLSYGFEKKKTNAITILLEMLYIPDMTNYQYLMGTSTTGRTDELWLNSDIGYMRLFFAYGILFLFVLTPYIYILLESIKMYKSIYAKLLMFFTILIFIVNLKELMFYGRHLFIMNLLFFFMVVIKPLNFLKNKNEEVC